jgi:tripartite-type tricarboxylate transporter receptor subunit TctC
MKKHAECLTIVFLIPLLLFCPMSPAMAREDYPTRPIEIIVGWGPGGTTDLASRIFAEKWAEFLGKPVVVVNKPGGGGMLGPKFVANADPDGYTLLAANDANLISSRLGRKNAGFNLDSYRYFFSLTTKPCFLIVKADAKWKSIKDFVQDAKQNPKKLTYGAMMGSTNHYLAAIFSKVAGVELVPVFFKKSPDIATALLGGHIDLGTFVGTAGLSESPLARILAVAEEERIPRMPKVPTLQEMGFPVLVASGDVLCGPKALPDNVVNKFVDAHNKMMAKYGKEIKQKLEKIDIEYTFRDGNSTLANLREKEKQKLEYAPLVGVKLK